MKHTAIAGRFSAGCASGPSANISSFHEKMKEKIAEYRYAGCGERKADRSEYPPVRRAFKQRGFMAQARTPSPRSQGAP
jgi:hypothetical protein